MKNLSPKTFFILFLTIYISGGLIATALSIVYNYNKEYVGITFLIGSIAVLLLKNKNECLKIDKRDNKMNLSFLFKFSIILYFILCTVLIYIFFNSTQQYYLPLEYFIVILIISGIIFSQILLNEDLSKLYGNVILFEILLLNTIVFSSFLFLFPGPYGNDAPYHVNFIKDSMNIGFLSGEGQYLNYPVFHLLFIYLSEVCKIENFKIIQIILLITQNIFLLFGFMLTKKVFNKKIALISVLILSFAPYISQAKYFYFPSTFTAIIFILSLFLIFYREKYSTKYSLLLIISFLSIIFTHPMTPIIVIAALIILLLTSKLQSKREKVTLTLILLLLVITISWWMKPSDINASDLFTYSILSIRRALETMDYSAVGSATLAPLMNKSTIISSDLGFILLICLAIIGALYVLKNYTFNSIKSNSLYLAIITLIFIPIPYILAVIYPQSLPNRWFPFIEIFASIFAGLSIFIIFNNISKNEVKFLSLFSLSFLIFLLVSNPAINPNSQLYAKDLSVRSALIQPEINALFFTSLYPDSENIKGDSKYIINLYRNYKNSIDPTNIRTFSNGLILLRKYEIEKGFTIPLWGKNNRLLDKIYADNDFYESLNKFNEIYDNGEVKMYINGT